MKRITLGAAVLTALACLGWLLLKQNSLPQEIQVRQTTTPPVPQNSSSAKDKQKSENKAATKPNCDCDVVSQEAKNFEPMRTGSSVTPIIHQSWKSRRLPTKRAKRWSASWRTCFPHWEWRLWTDEDNLVLVRDHYPWFLPVYLSFSKPVERADLARYFYMFHFGGVYTDLDNVCVRNFEHLLNSTELLFGGMDGLNDGDALLHTYVQNSFMASRPGHPFWMRLIGRVMLLRHLGKNASRPEYLTGPYVLMDELREYMKTKPSDTKIYKVGKMFIMQTGGLYLNVTSSSGPFYRAQAGRGAADCLESCDDDCQAALVGPGVCHLLKFPAVPHELLNMQGEFYVRF